MSLSTIGERFLDRTAKKTTEQTTATRSYQVVNDARDSGVLTIANAIAAGMPDIGDEHDDDDSLWVVDIDPKLQGDDGLIWNIKVSYGPKSAFQSDQGPEPWDRDPVCSTSFQSRQRVFEKAYAFNQTIDDAAATRNNPLIPVVNRPLWQPFDPPAMVDDFLLVIAIQRWIKADDFDANEVKTYQNTINQGLGAAKDESIRIAGFDLEPFTAWLRDYKTQPEAQNKSGITTKYVSETIELIIEPATWIRKIANMGVFKNDTVDAYFTGFKKIEDDQGDAVRDPVRLDLNGQPLPDPAGGADNTVYLEYHGIWEQDWTNLNLPTEYFPA